MHGNNSEGLAVERRTRFLESKGYTVFRTWNSDIHTNLAGVLTSVLIVLERSDE